MGEELNGKRREGLSGVRGAAGGRRLEGGGWRAASGPEVNNLGCTHGNTTPRCLCAYRGAL